MNRTYSIEGKRSTKRVDEISQKMRSSVYDINEPIEVVEYEQRRYIIDGHHRAVAARQTHTPVTIEPIRDIKSHKAAFNSTKKVVDASKQVGLDRLHRPRQ